MSRVHDISKRAKKDSPAKPVPEQEFEKRVQDSARLFAEALSSGREGEPQVSPEAARLAQQRAEDAMRGFLRDELTIVSPLVGQDGIDPQEKERQITRRALSRLSKLELQRAAESAGLRKSGSKEDLLDQLMRDIGDDRSRVSSIVDSIDRNPREGRRHASRLFAFDDLNETAAVARTLAPYEKTYVRTDVARWYVLRSVDLTADVLEIDGETRSYDVSLDEALSEHRSDLPVTSLLHDG
jgi:hypothetical protein